MKVSNKAKNWVIGILAVGVALVAGGWAANAAKATTKKLGWTDYQIAEIKDDGSLNKSGTGALVSKEVKADDIELDFIENAKAKVQVHYYDKDGKYISSTAELTTDTTLAAPEGAETARIEVTPTSDADGKITMFEKDGYIDQVVVEVEK